MILGLRIASRGLNNCRNLEWNLKMLQQKWCLGFLWVCSIIDQLAVACQSSCTFSTIHFVGVLAWVLEPLGERSTSFVLSKLPWRYRGSVLCWNNPRVRKAKQIRGFKWVKQQDKWTESLRELKNVFSGDKAMNPHTTAGWFERYTHSLEAVWPGFKFRLGDKLSSQHFTGRVIHKCVCRLLDGR